MTVNLLLPQINILKIVENLSDPEIENALFFNLLLSGRGIYEEVCVNLVHYLFTGYYVTSQTKKI